MLNPFKKSKLNFRKNTPLEKVEKKPNIITVFEFFDVDRKTIRRTGKATLACCPFHGESHPSFAMYENTNTYYCFACGATGDSYKFIMEKEKIGFKEAVEFAKQNNLL
jgi:DNA primase